MDVIELRRGRTRAIVAPAAGGRLHQLEIDDDGDWLPLLHTAPSPEALLDDPLHLGSYPMAPWPGRIDGGRFVWAGRQWSVPRNDPPHALHGRVAFAPWRIDAVSADACELSIELDSWPFAGSVVQRIHVVDRGIDQQIEVRAASGNRFPAGVGWHPWFRRDVRPGAAVRVRVDASQVYETHEIIPTGWLLHARGQHNLRGGPELGDRRIDACYRHPRGPISISWDDLTLTMASSPNVTHAVVFTPEHAVCVEPQTCAPDAFNLAAQGMEGAGMTIVSPSRPLIATTSWRWRSGG